MFVLLWLQRQTMARDLLCGHGSDRDHDREWLLGFFAIWQDWLFIALLFESLKFELNMEK